jgi:hypothetical protein
MPENLAEVFSITAGASHRIAVREGGTLVAWGRNSESQISNPPQASGVLKTASFRYHNLALLENGKVVAWGYDYYGQTTVPTDLERATDVAAGDYHSMALKPDGTVIGWGRSTDAQTFPPIGFSNRVTGIAAGAFHSLLLRDTSTDTAPIITTPPRDTNQTVGSAVSLSVVAGPVLPGHAFQWRKGGVEIAGATKDVFSIASAALADAGTYDVVVRNYLGSTVSSPAVVEIAPGPVILAAPGSITTVSGDRVQLRVSASGTGTLSYQWFRGTAGITTDPVSGANGATLTTPPLTATTSYWVRITDGSGNATNSPSYTVTVSATSPLTVTQQTLGPGYLSGGTVAITNTITYSGQAPSRIDWATLLPAGWKYLGSGGSEGGARPSYQTTDLLEWSWSTVPASPITFTYMVSVPPGTTGDQIVASLVSSQAAGTNYQTLAKPDPLVLSSASMHSADSNRDGRLSLLELTRVIELYNYRSGTTRTGQYKALAGTEDGFAPGP